MAKLQLAALATHQQPSHNELDARVSELKHREQRPPRISIWEHGTSVQSQPAAVAIPIAQAMIDLTVRPVSDGHRDGNDRKERELAALFETLTPVESLTLQRRLANPIAGDLLAAAFMRLVIERRTRLLSYLARRRTMR